MPGTPPGPPVQWDKAEDPDDVQPGYGYVPADTTHEEIFFYHTDHLGSTSYITDAKANVAQFDAYLPYGELLVDEHSSSEEMPYKFNGKELDQETGLYYYGARYMNPRTSLWYGVDPLAEKYQLTGSYVYCSDNPVKIIDIDGNDELYINNYGKIIKFVDNKSNNIVIVDPNGGKKYFSDFDISSGVFGWSNGANRQIIANVTGYYARKAGVLGLVGAVGSKSGQAFAYYSHDDRGIWVTPGENGKPNNLLSNKYNLMNTLKHENYHKEDHDKGLYVNHYLHASVVERASKDFTFSKTSLEYKKAQAGYFSQLAMAAYYQPDGNSKNDVLKLINKFNATNKGGIHLDFEKGSKKMIITINKVEYQLNYPESKQR